MAARVAANGGRSALVAAAVVAEQVAVLRLLGEYRLRLGGRRQSVGMPIPRRTATDPTLRHVSGEPIELI